MQEIVEQLNLQTVGIIIVLLFADILLGATLAYREGKYDMQRLGDAFIKKGLPTFIVLLFAAGLKLAGKGSEWEPWVDGAYLAITGALTLPLLGSVLSNLKTHFNIDILPPPGTVINTPPVTFTSIDPDDPTTREFRI